MVRLPSPPLSLPLENPETVQVWSFPVGPLRCNCSIVADPVSKQAILVDPGGDAEKIQALIAEQGLSIVQILHTHAHFDHFMASGHLRESTGAPLALHKADAPMWVALEQQCARYGLSFTPVPPPDRFIEDEEALTAGGITGQALHTPGHSPGSCCFVFDQAKLLLSGDTLFKGSVGRTDLWGGNFKTLERSIQTRLYKLDEGLTVIPGHGPQTSIGDELRSNPYVTPQ